MERSFRTRRLPIFRFPRPTCVMVDQLSPVVGLVTNEWLTSTADENGWALVMVILIINSWRPLSGLPRTAAGWLREFAGGKRAESACEMQQSSTVQQSLLEECQSLEVLQPLQVIPLLEDGLPGSHLVGKMYNPCKAQEY